ncbi:TPA: DNA cytosine methyltransferase [Klebsiella aerogenes]|nr:DNA cytosine methyltransferase [Klebsiella aerogenes]
MTAYYNEIDPFAAQWLRNLIDAGHIAPGVVDTRSIEDVTPNDLEGFTQVHLFAGIAGWSLALRRAGWPDNRPVWTGSCPCQPFSPAGRGGGFTDERHLWPAMHWLVGQCRPVVVFGEQSGSSHANNWIDLVQADVEALGYAFGAVAFPSASVGAPHQRDRAYWVADTDCEQHQERHTECRKNNGEERCGQAKQFTGRGESCCMADADSNGREGRLSGRTDAEREDIDRPAGRGCTARGASPVNGFWRDADWLHCRDGKWRPVRPGSFPLADGVPGRVGRLRAYGNAINIEAATAFIKSYMATVGYV